MTALASFYDGEWSMTPIDLSTLFLFKGWEYANSLGVPSESDIRQMISELVAEVSVDGRPGVMANRGRFLAVKHSELDSSVDVYLNVGFVWDKSKTDEEEFDELYEYGLIVDDEEYDSE